MISQNVHTIIHKSRMLQRIKYCVESPWSTSRFICIVACWKSLLPSMSTRIYKFGSTSGPVSFELVRRKAVKMGCYVTSGHSVPGPKYIGVHNTVMRIELLLMQVSSTFTLKFTVDNLIDCKHCRIKITATSRQPWTFLGIMNESNCKFFKVFSFFCMFETHKFDRTRTYLGDNFMKCASDSCSKQNCAERCHERGSASLRFLSRRKHESVSPVVQLCFRFWEDWALAQW